MKEDFPIAKVGLTFDHCESVIRIIRFEFARFEVFPDGGISDISGISECPETLRRI